MKFASDTLFLILFFALALGVCGCGTAEKRGSDRPESVRQQDVFLDGKLVLGSPSLTAGIPGNGALNAAQIQRWLDDPDNHEPLDVVLPVSLTDEQHPMSIPTDNPLTRAKIELGRQLFFDKRLSGLGTFSCAECHQHDRTFTSFQVMPEVDRNVSTIHNRILGEHHFWDGRAATLEEQPRSPIENPFEMNSSAEQSTQNIASVPGYRMQFERVFGEVTFENICKAIAAFERCLVTADSAWDRGELDESAKRGEALFFSDRLACSQCHTGPNLTDEAFYNLGAHLIVFPDDIGRAKVTGKSEDTASFKTPSLRNVAVTPPYMHNGAFRTLEQAIDFFDAGGRSDPELPIDSPLAPLGLSPTEKQDLIAFLKSLTSDLPTVATDRLPEQEKK